MSKDSRDLLVGLDIGTSKVVALVAELSPDGQFNVLGLGQTSSKGLKKGVVVNIEANTLNSEGTRGSRVNVGSSHCSGLHRYRR